MLESGDTLMSKVEGANADEVMVDVGVLTRSYNGKQQTLITWTIFEYGEPWTTFRNALHIFEEVDES